MKIISKFIILLVCSLFWTNIAVADGYEEIDCPASGVCPEGYTKLDYVDKGLIWDDEGCVCYKCAEGEECQMQHGTMKGCASLPSKLSEAKDCKFCPLFDALFKAVQTMATQAFETTKDPISTVMLYGFAIYMAFAVLKLVSSMTKQDAPKYITGLLVDTFKFGIALLLLDNSSTIYYYVINPLLATALDFGGSMLFTTGEAINTCKTDTTALSQASSSVLPDALYTTLECFVKGVQSEIAFVQAAGSSIMCVSWHEASFHGIPDFSMLFSGMVVYVCALLLSFAFGFYLIDAVVMLGVLGALMTFFIACWPFKITGGYTGKGFNMFMNIFFTFIFMGIVVSINTQLIKASLAAGGLENLEQALSGNNMNDAKQVLDITGVGFLIVLCCCFFGFKFSAKAASLASSMAGGGGIDIGAKLGGLLASGAVNSATRVGKTALKPVTDKAKAFGNKALDVTYDAISHPFKSARKLGGVMTKRYGQAQKAVGGTQAIIGNLTGNQELAQKGSELYNKGKMNKSEGQSRIDREDAGMHPDKYQDMNYEDFNPRNQSEDTSTQIEANSEKEGSKTPQTTNNEESKGAVATAYEKFDNEYSNVQPQTAEECANIATQAQQDYMTASIKANNDFEALGEVSSQMHIAKQDMESARQKMLTASTDEQRNAASQQYAKAEARYNDANTRRPALENAYHNSRGEAMKQAMVYSKYSSAKEQMEKGIAVDWNVAHNSIRSREINTAEQILKKIQNSGPRNS